MGFRKLIALVITLSMIIIGGVMYKQSVEGDNSEGIKDEIPSDSINNPTYPIKALEVYIAQVEEDKRVAVVNADVKQAENNRVKRDGLSRATLSRGSNPTPRKLIEVLGTAYVSDCNGCIGITKTGYDVRKTIYYEDMRIIAVDPKVIPLKSIVDIYDSNGDYLYRAIALDTGGLIKGFHIDILFDNKDKALEWGKPMVNVEIVELGEKDE